MATNNAVNVPLSGNTGTGNFVGSNSPTLNTPNVGVATATSLVFTPTTNGIIGTTTNNNAVAGSVGEVIQSAAPSGVSYTTSGVVQNGASISLTAGDWDVYGSVLYSSAALTTNFNSGISLVSATIPSPGLGYNLVAEASGATSTGISTGLTYSRLSLSGTTTVYLVTSAGFSGSAPSFFAQIAARRAR